MPASTRPHLAARGLALLGLAAVLIATSGCDWTGGPGGSDNVFAEAEARMGHWSFVEVPGSTCRDGSGTGFGVRLQPGADNLMIYLQGGGACLDPLTCALNPSKFSKADFGAFAVLRGRAGIFNPIADNPVGDWNVLFVPYCTGDVHGGTVRDATVPGVEGAQQFVGHRNVERMLDLAAPYFGDPGTVLVAGASAGGFGALLNFAEVADRFGASDHVLLDDSGPVFFADDVFSPAFGDTFASLFGFPAALPADAAPLFATDGLEDIYGYYADRYPEATFGVSSYLEDVVIRFFFAPGQPDRFISGTEYAAGLRDVRGRLPADWGTYFAPGPAHTFLGADDTYFGASVDTGVDDWLGGLISGTAADVEVGVDPAAAAAVASR